MKKNWIYIIIISLFVCSCGKEQVKMEVKPHGDLEKLADFFRRSEGDSVRAGAVIEKQRIIQHLTHLKRMNRGGKKYYLLEKDDITEMINAVTEGVYLDYILINRNGEVVYTKRNNELFGVNITSGFESTPLLKCFSNRSGVYFEDVSPLAQSSRIYSLYVSTPVYVENEFHGILILQVEIEKIREILEADTEIFSRDGIFRITPFQERVFSKYSGFDSINLHALDSNRVVMMEQSEGKFRFSKFSFREIDWILMNRL